MIISEVTREVDERVTVLRDKATWCVRTVRNRLLWLVSFIQAFPVILWGRLEYVTGVDRRAWRTFVLSSILSVVVFVASVIAFRKSGCG